jgi:hypothetical protein
MEVRSMTKGPDATGPRTGDPHELLRQYLAIYDSYHNHKEVMAYTVTAFYIGGATVLFVGTPPFWKDYQAHDFALLLVFLTVLAGLAFVFVRHQLMLRRSAGYMFKACSRLANKWLATAPGENDLTEGDTELDETLFRGFRWPHALVNELNDVRRAQSNRWWARDLTYGAMSSAALLVLIRLLASWNPPQNLANWTGSTPWCRP